MKIICDYCGKEFNKKPSAIKRAKRNFCCLECKRNGNYLIEKRKSKYLPMKCPVCQKEFIPRNNRQKFCNNTCYGLSKRNRIQLICENCGIEYEKKISSITKNNRNFCSKKCYVEAQNTNEYVENEEYASIIINSPKFGKIEVFIDNEDIEKCKKHTWIANYDKGIDNFYIRCASTKIKIHRIVTNCPKGLEVDHINHNTLDNRKQNLKVCTHYENMQNMTRKNKINQ